LVDDSDVNDVAAEKVQIEVVKNVMGNEDIDPSACCMCFQSWHDDVGCVSYKCAQKLH